MAATFETKHSGRRTRTESLATRPPLLPTRPPPPLPSFAAGAVPAGTRRAPLAGGGFAAVPASVRKMMLSSLSAAERSRLAQTGKAQHLEVKELQRCRYTPQCMYNIGSNLIKDYDEVDYLEEEKKYISQVAGPVSRDSVCQPICEEDLKSSIIEEIKNVMTAACKERTSYQSYHGEEKEEAGNLSEVIEVGNFDSSYYKLVFIPLIRANTIRPPHTDCSITNDNISISLEVVIAQGQLFPLWQDITTYDDTFDLKNESQVSLVGHLISYGHWITIVPAKTEAALSVLGKSDK